MRTPLVLTASLLLAASVAAQQASYTFFGQGCPTGEPHFSVVGVPRLGGSFVVRAPASCRAQCSDGGFEAWIMTGFSNTRFGALRLPFDLGVLSSPPCTHICGPLLVSIEAMDWTPFHATASTVDVTYRVPNTQSLLGLSIYQQVLDYHWGVFNPCGVLRSWTTSRGGHGVIGT